MFDGVGDHESATVTTGRGIPVAVLEILQLASIAVPKTCGGGLHVDVVHVARAVCESGDGEEQRGADDAADLKTGVIVAVSECRQLDDARVALHRRAELLREDRAGDADVLELVPAVRDGNAVSSAWVR